MLPLGLLAKAGDKAGAMMKTGLSLGSAAVQGIKANKLKKDAESAYPDLIDPQMSSYLSELAQKKRSMETGADFASSMKNIDQSIAGTQENLTNVTGGDTGGTIQAMLQAQMTGQNAKNQALAAGQQNQLAYENLYGNTLRRIADQKLQLQMQRSQQRLAEWARMKQSANQNFMAGMGSLTGLMGKGAGQQQSQAPQGDTSTDFGPVEQSSSPVSMDGANISNSGMPSVAEGAAGGGPDLSALSTMLPGL